MEPGECKVVQCDKVLHVQIPHCILSHIQLSTFTLDMFFALFSTSLQVALDDTYKCDYNLKIIIRKHTIISSGTLPWQGYLHFSRPHLPYPYKYDVPM